MFYVLAFTLVSIVFRIVFRFHVEGRENLTRYKTNGRPFVVCANHLNMFDPLFIIMAYGAGKRLSVMGKAELFKNPVLGWALRQLNCFPVERGTGDRSALDRGIADIKNGHGMLIFPEGHRGESDTMQRVKSGAFMIAAETGADIIPVRMIYPTKSRKMKLFGTAVVKIGRPLLAEDMDLTSGSKRALRRAKGTYQASMDSLLAEYNRSVGYIPPRPQPAEEELAATEE